MPSWMGHEDVTAYDPTFEDSYRNQYVIDIREAWLVFRLLRTRRDGTIREQPMRAGERFLSIFPVTARGSGKNSISFKDRFSESRMEMSSQ